MVADCVPVLLCSSDGAEVCAVHAGWRGLANGIIAKAAAAFAAPARELIGWIGPCIGVQAYRVGADVHAQIKRTPAGSASSPYSLSVVKVTGLTSIPSHPLGT